MISDETLFDPPEYPLFRAQDNFTTEKDVRLLIYLSHLTAKQNPDGAIVEIGCNEGATLRNLALYNGWRICYGYDPGVSTNPDQSVEESSEIGKLVQGLSNTIVIGTVATSQSLPGNIALAFIDGDHTYEGVQRDYEAVRPSMGHGGIIAFHDYTARDRRPLYEKSWIGVSKFVDTLDTDLTHVCGTSICWMRV